MAGFIKLYRDQLNNTVFKNAFLLQIWIYLCKQAKYQKTIQDGMELLPGQLLVSVKDIAKECGQTEDKVKYYLQCLEKQGLIRRENIRFRCTLITVLTPDEQSAAPPVLPSAPVAKPADIVRPAVSVQPSPPQKKPPAPPPKYDKNGLTDTVSYDLEAAERRARESVPTLKKRRRTEEG